MTTRPWLRSYRDRLAGRPRRPASRPTRLRVEALEDRATPAGWPAVIETFGVESPYRAGLSVATDDAAGTVYVSGYFEGTADFDPSPDATAYLSAALVRNSHNTDGFVAAYSREGDFLWARRFGGGNGFGSVAVLPGGGVCVAGYFKGTGDITGVDSVQRTEYSLNRTLTSANTGGKKPTYYQEGLVMTFGAGGAIGWVKQFGGVGPSVEAHSVAVSVDATGAAAVHVGGYFSGSADFDRSATHADGRDLLSSASTSYSDGFVLRLDAAAGGFGWVSRVGGSQGTDRVWEVAVGGDGSVLVAGSFSGADAFPGQAVTYRGGADAFVAKLDASGAMSWARGMGGTDGDYANGVAVHGDGTAYVSGSFLSAVAVIGDETFSNPGYRKHDSFVARLDGRGTFQWSRQFTDINNMGAGALAVDAEGSAYVAGWFSYSVDFDPKATHAGDSDLLTGTATDSYLAKLGSDGTFRWATRLGLPDTGSMANEVAVDAAGAVYVSGDSSGYNGIFVAKRSQESGQPVGGSGSPLTAAAAPPGTPAAAALTAAQARPLLAEALRRWRLAGADVSKLGPINLQVADLPGRTLGQAQGRTITLDANAAGWGWYVDRTPQSDGEFRGKGDPAAKGRIDLLSVLLHEVGHLLGRGHEPHGVMAEALPAGVRELPDEVPSSRWAVDVRPRR